jgi:Na+-driven multidrug efflux pump
VAAPTDPATQAKGLKVLAMSLVSAGLLVGVGLPVLFVMFKIEVLMMSSGFDAIWLVFLAMMIVDFAMAWWFWRRAAALDRAAQGLPPRE